MELPFTTEQFFDVFRQYNNAVWPVQVALNLIAFAAIGLVIRWHPYSGRLISAILALLWAWTGIVYHLLYFSAINKAAIAFGAVYLAGSGAFLWAGVIKRKLEFTSNNAIHRILGSALVAYALVIYPALSGFFGHRYPAVPTFGLPCPTTIFTFGMLCFAAAPFPRYVLAAPLLWAVIGFQAAFLFNVYQDFGLLVAGIIGVFPISESQRLGISR